MITVGLDISTSVIGISIVDQTKPRDQNVLLLDYIKFSSKQKTFWEKATCVKDKFNEINQKFSVDKINIEESLQKFEAGRSNSQTISAMIFFNGIVSYIAYTVFGKFPVHINATKARSNAGIKMQRVKKCGKSQKEQVWDHMIVNDLAQVNHSDWPVKKDGSYSNVCKDMCDAYVVAIYLFKLYSYVCTPTRKKLILSNQFLGKVGLTLLTKILI